MSAIATTARDEVLIARNPATGLELGRVPATPPEHVGDLVKRARCAQASWASAGWRARRAVLKSWWKILSRDADRWADLVRSEIGKPRIEAMGGEVLSSLDAIRWTVRRGGATLADRQIGPAWQRWLTMSGCRCRWVPLGVIGMLGTWNYPLFLNAPPIAQALAAGNAVVWKASELAPLCGALLEEGLKEAGFPEGLVAIIQGGPDVGRALVDSDLDKGMFTGGVENGRRVLATLAGRGIPAVAELSGFDPAIVLADAPMESTVKALTWAAFVGCGQTCVAVKRIFVVGDPTPWADALATSARALRVGDPESPGVDVGPMISANARERFHAMVRASTDAGGSVLAGGEPIAGPGSFYPPTVILAASPDSEDALAGVFGPVVVIRGVPDPRSAVEAANRSPFALAASVWGRDRRRARELASMIHAGMVTINDAVTPTAHASAPFGGSKSSGFGRTKGPIGLLEFTQPQVVFERSVGGFRPQLFPYSSSAAMLDRFFGVYRFLFHPRADR
ncbi:MAG: aldehyde dehydrogenase family protein [Isosphaeraceae bacterium]